MNEDILGNFKTVKEKNRKEASQDILPDLVNFQIGDDIKIEATELFRKCTKRVRKENRKNILFSIVYKCFAKRGINDLIGLADMFGINRKAIPKALDSIANFGEIIDPSSTILTPTKAIENYCSKLNIIGDSSKDIMTFSEKILKNDRTLYDENPDLIGFAILMYYFEVHGIEMVKTNKDTKKILELKLRVEKIFNES